MESPILDEQYHVVCRECRVEGLFDAGADAAELEREHAEETGHHVVFERVQ